MVCNRLNPFHQILCSTMDPKVSLWPKELTAFSVSQMCHKEKNCVTSRNHGNSTAFPKVDTQVAQAIVAIIIAAVTLTQVNRGTSACYQHDHTRIAAANPC